MKFRGKTWWYFSELCDDLAMYCSGQHGCQDLLLVFEKKRQFGPPCLSDNPKPFFFCTWWLTRGINLDAFFSAKDTTALWICHMIHIKTERPMTQATSWNIMTQTIAWCWMMLNRLSSESSHFLGTSILTSWIVRHWQSCGKLAHSAMIRSGMIRKHADMFQQPNSIFVLQYSELVGYMPGISPLKHQFMAWYYLLFIP